MALHDLGHIPFAEPFPRIRLGGLIVRGGARMSKSRGNVVSPDDYIDTHGADVLRCALLFSAPWEQGGDFTDDGIAGVERFFARAWRVVTGPDNATPDTPEEARTIVAVSEAIERLAFNVGLARLMEFAPKAASARSKRVFVRLLAPFAPHLAEELWHQLGEPFSVHTQRWPEPDRTALIQDEVVIVVQVDGRVRGTIVVPADAGEPAIAATARTTLTAIPDEANVSRVVFVANRLLNFVTPARTT